MEDDGLKEGAVHLVAAGAGEEEAAGRERLKGEAVEVCIRTLRLVEI